MIDSIKITLKDFSGNFDNCRETSEEVFEHPKTERAKQFLSRYSNR